MKKKRDLSDKAANLRPAHAEAEAELERYADLYEFAPVGYFHLDHMGTIRQANLNGARLLGADRAALVSKHFETFVADGDRSVFMDFFKKVFAGQAQEACELALRQENSPLLTGGTYFDALALPVIRLDAQAAQDGKTCRITLVDVSERRHAELRREVENELLRICQIASSTLELIQQLTLYFKRLTGCEAVGVRLHKGEDFPYYVTSGFSENFVKAESSLCARDARGELLRDNHGNPVLECMCGNILRSRIDPAQPFFTTHGSFWSSGTSKLLATTTEVDRQARTRNRCNGEGYESVALVPLRSQQITYGLFQFNDPRLGCFNPERIALLEHLVDYVALAVANQESKAALAESESRYHSLMEQASDGIFLADRDGHLLDANFIGCDMLGYTLSEIVKLRFQDLIHPDDLVQTPSHIPEILQGAVIRSERRARRKDGRVFPVEINAKMLSDGSLQGIVRDISDRKQAEQRSWLAENRLRSLLETAQANAEQFEILLSTSLDGLLIIHRDGRILDANDAYCKMTGYGKPELLQLFITSVEAHETPEETAAHIQAIIRAGTDRFESRLRCKDGRIIDVEVSSTFIPLKGHFLSFFRDITARKRAQAELYQSEQRFRQLAENIHEVFWLRDSLSGQMLYVSPSYEQIWGHPCQELYQNPQQFIDGIHPDDREQVKAAQNALQLTGKAFEENYRILHPDGSIRWIQARTYPVRDESGQTIRYAGIAEDFTERKRSEDERRQLEDKFRKAFHISPDSININRLEDGLYIDINEGFTLLTGYTAEEAIGKTSLELNIWVNPQDRERLVNGLRETGEVINLEAPFRTKNGQIIICLMSAKIIEVSGETSLLSITRDITGRKKIEEELRYSEERYRLLFEEMAEGFALFQMVCDEQGQPCDFRCLDINPAFEALTGVKREAIIGRTLGEELPQSERYWIPFYAQVVLSGNSMQHEYFYTPRGKWFNLVAFNPKPGQLAVTLADISERKQAEAQVSLLNSQLEQRVRDRTAQLEAANQELEAFSYSVSHDLRAPLRAIEGFSTVLLEDYPDRLDEAGQAYLGKIRDASQRMGQLIHDLLNLSRITRVEFVRQRVDLSLLAREIAVELHAQDPQRRVNFEIAAPILVDGDLHLLKIVLENLLNNAFKFTNQREESFIQVGVLEQAGERVYYVRDNGAGFDMAYAGKLFTPFQRLHGALEFPGTGIGLVTVQRIITRHGGRIWPESVLNQGATFYFTLSSVEK